MGWSCTKAAGDTMDRWSAVCRKATGSSNAFKVGPKKFFFEGDNVEHDDGSITGEVFAMVGESSARSVGKFHIGPGGEVLKAPSALKIVHALTAFAGGAS